jgi:hypothetical protein
LPSSPRPTVLRLRFIVILSLVAPPSYSQDPW